MAMVAGGCDERESSTLETGSDAGESTNSGLSKMGLTDTARWAGLTP